MTRLEQANNPTVNNLTRAREVAITRNRFLRARKLCDVIQSVGANSSWVADLTEASWLAAAKVADIDSPSAVTRMLVIELMRDREELR